VKAIRLALRALFAAAFVAIAAGAAAAEAAPPPTGEWDFRVLLDDKPIGRHRFMVRGQGDDREVTSEASFAVTLLGFTAYHYEHRATERWHGNCLSALSSSTDDNGKAQSAHLEWHPDAPPASIMPPPGCVMSFAYWNPAIRTQASLLNSQTGKLESVRIEAIGSSSIEVHGRPRTATGFRITGPANPIEVWYSSEGEWIGLDSVVGAGRKLSYRLP
jgi:hypothetical protein